MFAATRKQLATVRSMGIRTKDERQKDTNHIVEFTFEVPLTRDLAEEILPALAGDLFDGDGHPKAEINNAGLIIPNLGQQMLVVRDHPELEAMATVRSVNIRNVQAKKAEDGKALVLSFQAGWVLGDDGPIMLLIRRIKKGTVYLQMEPEQTKLELPAEEAAEQPAKAARGRGGKVTDIETGKKRGRKKAGKQPTPEAVAKDQQQAGADAVKAEETSGDQPADPAPEPDPAPIGDPPTEGAEGIETAGDELRPGVVGEFQTDQQGQPNTLH